MGFFAHLAAPTLFLVRLCLLKSPFLLIPLILQATKTYASRTIMSVFLALLLTLRSWTRSRAVLQLEVLALRHQLQVLQRTRPRRLRLATTDRWLWMWLARVWTDWRRTLVIVKPETVIAWHRSGFRLYWRWRSRRRTGRPLVSADVRILIRTMSQMNPRWGAPRIHGELLKLGMDVCQATVAKYMVRCRRPPSQTWRTFLANHVGQIMAADFFVVPTATGRLLFVLVILAHARRRIVHMADGTSDGGLDQSTAPRGVPVGGSSSIYGPRSRSRVRRLGDHCKGHGDRGRFDGPTLPVAERVRRTVHRIRAARMSRSRRRVERDRTSAAHAPVSRLLRAIPNALVAEQGRADPAPERQARGWSSRGHPAGGRASPPVRTSGGLTPTVRLPRPARIPARRHR
jgi:hypothetical protein